MRATFLVGLMLAMGCTSKSPPVAPVQSEADAAPIAAFSGVVHYDGSPRTQQDLIGHPTVVWFFPFAGTPG